MALTGRTALLALLGAVVLSRLPGGPRASGWTLVAVLVGVDLLLAGSPKSMVWQRSSSGPHCVLAATTASILTVTNTGSRRVRGHLRTPGSPRPARAVDRHPLDVPPGERRRDSTRC